MTKISPIAEYLTANKAFTKKEGNICHFISPEGLYLGRQITIQQPTGTAYIREIYGNCFQRLFYECKIIAQQCVYYKDNKAPVGISIAPVKTFIVSKILDFVNNTAKDFQYQSIMQNKANLIGKEKTTNTGIFDIIGKFRFKETVIENKTEPLRKNYRVNHTLN